MVSAVSHAKAHLHAMLLGQLVWDDLASFPIWVRLHMVRPDELGHALAEIRVFEPTGQTDDVAFLSSAETRNPGVK